MGRIGGVLADFIVNMLCCLPAGAIVTKESETTDITQKAEYGIVVKSGDVTGIWSAFLRLKENAPVHEVMGSNGRACLEENVALQEEIFSVLAGDGVLVGRSVSSRGDMLGVGQHWL